MPIMGRKLKVSARQGIMTPTTTTKTTKTTTISKPAHNSVHHRSDKDHTTAEPPTKRRWIASSRSNASQASIDNLDCDNVPDVPETGLPELEEIWKQAKKMAAPPVPSTSLTKIGKSLGTYTARIFMHRSIRYRQTSKYQQLYKSDVKQSQLQYAGDLVLADEDETNATFLDGIIRSLNHRLPNERTWETELYAPYIFPQTGHPQIPEEDNSPAAVRLLQHTMKTVVREPGMQIPYTSHPPIVSNVDRRLTYSVETAPPWLTPIKEGKVINDIVYAVNDHCFWRSTIGGEVRDDARAKLAGYKLFPDSDHMLPYLLIEDKRHEDKRHGNSLEYAIAYVILIAASILHQRLKLRALGNMRTTFSCPELIVHCIVMVGSKAHYIRVGLRGPAKTDAAGTGELHYVRYQGESRGYFNLMRYNSRNQFKGLLRMIHAFGFGSHHEAQKLEVKNAVDTLNSVEDGLDSGVDMESIMSVDTAFHCVPVEGQEGEYVLQHTDITMNSRKGDDLEPDLPSPVDYADTGDVDMWNVPSSTDESEARKADTRKNPAKPAAKAKLNRPRKRKIAARVDEEQEEEFVSKRVKPRVNYKE